MSSNMSEPYHVRIEPTTRPFDVRLILLGGLLGAAFYLVQAGVAEIVLAENAACLARTEQLRIGFLPEEVCMPEWQRLLFQGATRGIPGVILRRVPLAGRALTAILYVLLGGVCSQLPRKMGLIVFLLSAVFMVAVAALLSYLAQFIL